MPMPTPGSPASMRMRVGTVTPMREAQEARDSFRRSRATAKSAPSFSSALDVAGGSRWRATGVLGILKIIVI